jgi:putative radical SAM enzyme (TIGR03279 family)
MKAFAAAGIVMNCQIVVCPGLNDGEHLSRTMKDLAEMGVASCAVVPVGLTKFRRGCYKMPPVDEAAAVDILERVLPFGEECLQKYGTRLFFCSDEIFIRAKRPLPEEDYYEGYVQLENGVGMLRSMENEFLSALAQLDEDTPCRPFSIGTGCLAAPFIRDLVAKAKARCPAVDGTVYAVENNFFGKTIDVAGLVTATDLMEQLKGKPLGERLLLPASMLRHGGDVFLDDYTVEDVERALDIPVTVTAGDGFSLVDSIFEIEY